MKTNCVRNWAAAILGAVTLFMMQACSQADEPKGNGEVEFQITDAPIDDANVKGVFVTVTDIKIDGQSISGFTKQTIDLRAYQDGNAKLLGNTQLDSRTYHDLVLVLDADADANGVAPGCYVITADNNKYKLKSGKIELQQTTGWTVFPGSKTTVIFDFDLRKAIRNSSDASVKYQFVSDANLRTSVRLITKAKTGTISGSYTEQGVGSEKVIVYAYKTGTFNTIVEITPQGGEDAIFFKNAVSSAEVKTSLTGTSYTIALIEEGDYELHFASYKKDALSDKFILQSMLKTQTSASGSDLVTVRSGSMVTLSTVVTGIL